MGVIQTPKGLKLNSLLKAAGSYSLTQIPPLMGPVSLMLPCMLDNGNFVLSNGSGNAWESFKNPSDTILPGQVIEIGGTLSSRRAQAGNYSKGRFQLQLIPDGNFVLNTLDVPTDTPSNAYYWSNTYDGHGGARRNSGRPVIFNESGYLYVALWNGGKVLSLPKIITIGIGELLILTGSSPSSSSSTATSRTHQVAVKNLDRLAQGGENEFKTEASIIGMTHHNNLVRLLGVCDDGPRKLLVYEFMSNGTLGSFLFGDSTPDWQFGAFKRTLRNLVQMLAQVPLPPCPFPFSFPL